MAYKDDYSSNKIVVSSNPGVLSNQRLRSNMVSSGQLEQSRQYTGDSDGYESEATPYNLRKARSPTEGKTSKGDSGKSKNKVVNSANVRANKRVKFISNDE